MRVFRTHPLEPELKGFIHSIMKKALLIAVRMYQVWLGPLVGGMCRFYPSCSHYAVEAIERHGARRGAALALRRVLRCHPFSAGGVDLVPEMEITPRAQAGAAVFSSARGDEAQTRLSVLPRACDTVAQPRVAALPRTREEFGR